MKLFLLGLLLVIFSNFYSQVYFPKYEEVLTYLDKELVTGPKEGYFHLSKKPKGYYLEIKDYYSREIIAETIVWESKSRNFLKFNLDEYLYSLEILFEGFSDSEIQNYLKNNSINGIDQLRVKESSYDFHLFYGYSEWDSDLINTLRQKSNYTLKELDQLARAYDRKACEYIHPGQYGTTLNFAKDFKDGNYEKIEKFRIEKFIEYSDTSLSYYDRIIEIDSNYATFIIGNVKSKKSNNCMHYYNYLNSVKEYELAAEYLSLVDYPEPFINLAKNFLKYCSDESILITNGDNDTYPLWYVQKVLNVRKDIAVVNVSLLGVPWYISMVKEEFKLKTVLDLNSIYNNEIFYFPVEFYKSSDTNSVSDLINVLKKYSSVKHANYSNKIKMGGNCLLNYQNKELPISINDNAVYLQNAIMLDLINSNDSKFFFASNFIMNNYGLNPYLKNKFLVFELYSDPVENKYDERSKKYLYDEIHMFSPDIINYSGNTKLAYLYPFYDFLSFLEKNDEKDKKDELSKVLRTKLPEISLSDIDLDSFEVTCLLLNQIYTEGSFNKILHSFLTNELIKVTITKDNCKEVLKKLNTYYRVLRYLYNSSKNEISKESFKLILDKIESLKGNDFLKSYKWTKLEYISLKKSIEEIIRF